MGYISNTIKIGNEAIAATEKTVKPLFAPSIAAYNKLDNRLNQVENNISFDIQNIYGVVDKGGNDLGAATLKVIEDDLVNFNENPLTTIQRNQGYVGQVARIAKRVAYDTSDIIVPGARENLRDSILLNAPLVATDNCNIDIVTNLGTLHYRNPYCTPSIKPEIQVTSGKFFIPPNGCNQSVVFSFIESNGKLISGADKFGYFVDGGKTPLVPGTMQTGGGLDNIYSPSFTTFLYDTDLHYPSTIIVRYLELNGVGYALYATALTFDDIQLRATNGVIDPAFPLYKFNNQYIFAPWKIANIETGSCVPITPKFSPPPPSIEQPECECMCNDNLLKLVLQRIGNLPATVPTNIADTTNKTTQTLESVAEMIFWHVKQMDAISGQYPIPLTIKADPSVSGSKDTNLELPNIAETLAEILGLLIATKRDSHAGLVASISSLTEAGMIKNLATQTFDIAQANAEYLGYKLQQTKRTIPSTFTPNAKSISETLRPTNIDIVSYENKDTVDLQDEIKKLTTMADRWNAQNWRNLGTSAVTAIAGLQKNFVTSPQAVSNINSAVKEETFQQFLNEVQQGFTATPGVTDNTDPWGDSALDAPTVREVGIIDPNQPPPSAATPQQIKQNNNTKTVANIANLLSKL